MHHDGQDITGREIASFALGAAAALIAARLLPPLAGQAVGMARHAAGQDPFARLVADHGRFLDLLDAMVRTGDDQTFRRTQLLLRLKRGLAAHAMAEEDAVYPVLETIGEEGGTIDHLYAEHGEMKALLYALERMPKNAPEWRDKAMELRQVIAEHAREEEEVEFPMLRAALDRRATRRLAGTMARERAMVL